MLSKVNTKLDKIGLGLEERVKHKDASKNPYQGTRTSFTLGKNHLKNAANQSKAIDSILPKTSKIIQDLKKNNPLTVGTPAVGPLKESEMYIPKEAITRIEQSIELFENILTGLPGMELQEYSSSTYKPKVNSGASAPHGGGKGVESSSAQHSQLLASYKASVSNKLDTNLKKSALTNDISRDIEPGTGHIKNYETSVRADAMANGARNNARTVDRLDQQYQDKLAKQEQQG